MIFKNNPHNATLARKFNRAIGQAYRFEPMVDKDWNCGKDIRVEVSTVNQPFVVLAELTDENKIDLIIRMTKTMLDPEEIEELKYSLECLGRLNIRLNQILEDFELEA